MSTFENAPDEAGLVQVSSTRKVDIRLPGKGNSDSHGARPVFSNHLDDSVDSGQ